MFSKHEIFLLDQEYFKIIRCSQKEMVIESNNTKHCWAIVPIVTRKGKTFKIWHSHSKYNDFHDHANAATVESAIKKIKKHDDYHLAFR